MLPFHIARKYRCSAPIMDVLLQWYPAPASEHGPSGKVPFFEIICDSDGSNSYCDKNPTSFQAFGHNFELALTFLKHSLPINYRDGSQNLEYCNVWHIVLAESTNMYHPYILSVY